MEPVGNLLIGKANIARVKTRIRSSRSSRADFFRGVVGAMVGRQEADTQVGRRIGRQVGTRVHENKAILLLYLEGGGQRPHRS